MNAPTEDTAPAPVVTPTLPLEPVTDPEPTLYDPRDGYSDSDSEGDPDAEESSEIPDVRSVLALFMGELRNLAWLRMGLVANPMTGEIEKDLAQAQMAINTVGFLADQLERSAGSIAANISEGCGRETKADFKRFLTMAIASTTETENHLIRAHQRSLITETDLDSLTADAIEVRKVINGLRKSLE